MDELWTAYAEAIFRFANHRLTRLLGPQRADACVDDVVANTFVEALRALERYRGDAALYTFLRGICHHEIADVCRRSSRIVPLDEQAPFSLEAALRAASNEDRPDMELEQTEVSRQVHETLDALPKEYAELLERKYAQGQSVREIAAALGSTEKAVESRLTRARAAFRTAFGRDPSAGDQPT